MPMTTQRELEELPTFKSIEIVTVSSDPDEEILHPVLEIYKIRIAHD